MQGIQEVNGALIVSNQYGEQIISYLACNERGIKFDGHWLCPNDECRVGRFFTG